MNNLCVARKTYLFCQIITEVFLSFISATYNADVEDPYPSLSDFHDYEPNLEFDDSDLLQQKHPENDDGMIFFLFTFPYFSYTLVESFYSIKYGSSIICQIFRQIISVNENKNIGVSREMIFQKYSQTWQ